MYQKATQPLSIGKVLDNGIQLYRSSFSRVAALVTVIAILSAIPSLLANQFINQDTGETANISSQSGIVLIGAVIISMLLNFIFYAAAIHRIASVMNDTGEGMEESVFVGLKKFIPLILASILYGIAVMGGSLLLIIPGLIVAMSMIFYMPLIVVDNHGILGSLTASHKLVWGNWWRTSAVLLVPVILYVVLLVLVLTVAGLVSTFEGTIAGTSYSFDIGNILITIFMLPLFYCISLAQIHDLKLRRHGADLEARIAGNSNQVIQT